MSMVPNTDKWIAELGAHWEVGGTLWNIRDGRFDDLGLTKLESALRGVSFGDTESVSQELISLLWYIPLVLLWNASRIENQWRSELDSRAGRIETELLRILGDPRKARERPAPPKIDEILKEWAPGGFFNYLAKGVVDLAAGRKLQRQMVSLAAGQKELLDRCLVEAVWYIPTALERYLQERSLVGDPAINFSLRAMAYELQQQTTAILGIP